MPDNDLQITEPTHHPRGATESEVKGLEWYVNDVNNCGVDEAKGIVENAYVAVFERFVPDSPGYVGKAAVVIWPGGLSMIGSFMWDDEGHIQPVEWTG